MKIALLTLLAVTVAVAAEPTEKGAPKGSKDLMPKVIPKDVRYSKPKIEHARKAKSDLVKEFTDEKRSVLSTSPIVVSPKTWDRIERLKLIEPVKGSRLIVVLPDGTKVEGRGYREEPEIKIVWKFLRDCLHSKTKTEIRTPTEEEISIYWSEIGWDIEDSPLFVVKCGDERFLFAFNKDEVFLVIDLGNPKDRTNQDERGATGKGL